MHSNSRTSILTVIDSHYTVKDLHTQPKTRTHSRHAHSQELRTVKDTQSMTHTRSRTRTHSQSHAHTANETHTRTRSRTPTQSTARTQSQGRAQSRTRTHSQGLAHSQGLQCTVPRARTHSQGFVHTVKDTDITHSQELALAHAAKDTHTQQELQHTAKRLQHTVKDMCTQSRTRLQSRTRTHSRGQSRVAGDTAKGTHSHGGAYTVKDTHSRDTQSNVAHSQGTATQSKTPRPHCQAHRHTTHVHTQTHSRASNFAVCFVNEPKSFAHIMILAVRFECSLFRSKF